MSTRTEKNTLKRMSKERSFRIERRGDSHYGTAAGFRAKRLMLRGATTPAGSYLLSKGVHMPADRINRTLRTVFRGNSEFTTTQSGQQVRLRTADGGSDPARQGDVHRTRDNRGSACPPEGYKQVE